MLRRYRVLSRQHATKSWRTGSASLAGGQATQTDLARGHAGDRAVGDALGDGLPLFRDLATPLRLDLVEATAFPDGTAIHVYRPAAPRPGG
jgi:hypothetical protein